MLILCEIFFGFLSIISAAAEASLLEDDGATDAHGERSARRRAHLDRFL
jgi:hypothetical protein